MIESVAPSPSGHTASGGMPLGAGRARFGLRRRAQPYMDPYLAGVGVGVVLLAAFVVMGRGLGASGAFGSIASNSVAALAPEHAAANAVFSGYVGGSDPNPFDDWLVIEVLGITLGGLLSAIAAGRFRVVIDRGPRLGGGERLRNAFAGGAIMGLGAALARGCTSGQALTGGALLSVGSWLFILTAFGAGYAASPLFKGHWT
jgi:uncharacterized membrane protein YedE/YeeE